MNMKYFAKYQLIIGCRIAFSNIWHNNCQSGRVKAETLPNLIFKKKIFLTCFFFFSQFCKLNKKQGTSDEGIHLSLFLNVF